MSQTRRDYLVQTGLLAAASAKAVAPETYPRALTKHDIDRWMTELSNWGRWGRDDQAGSANLITAAKRKQAAGQVRAGVSLSLARVADVAPPSQVAGAGERRPTWQHEMTRGVGGRQNGFVIDSYTVSFHNTFTTHLDALSHGFYQGTLYNGFSNAAITDWGATKNDVMAFQAGFLTRGVLIDIPILKDIPYLAEDEPIYPEDLEAWESKARVRVESGDAVFIRTGNWRRLQEQGRGRGEQTPGLYASCAKWLRRRDIALLGSDTTHDVRPSRIEGVEQPIHQLLLISFGTPLLDCCDLDALSQEAIDRKRWTFHFTATPLLVPGGTGSPVNPIATF